MATTAGVLSLVSVSDTSAVLSSAVATAGTAPYTYQWYRSTTSGFTPGGGNIIAGATSLSLSDSGLTPSTTYYYKVVATDAGAVSDESDQLSVPTLAAVQSPNSFAQSSQLGMLDLKFNSDTISVQVDASQSGAILAGQAVKIVDNADGVPKVVKVTANNDQVFGFVNYDIKSQSFLAGDRLEISQDSNVMFLYSTTAIARGARVTVDIVSVGGVASANTGDRVVGFAMDKASGPGQLIRVKLNVPSFQLA